MYYRSHDPSGGTQCYVYSYLYVFFLGFRDTLLFSKSHHLRLFQYLGVPRETKEEKEIADFDIFDDPESPFSTFNFQYPNQAFKRLHDLMYFNTLNNIDVSISCDR